MSGRPHQTVHTIANHAVNFELIPGVEMPEPKMGPPAPPPEPPKPEPQPANPIEAPKPLENAQPVDPKQSPQTPQSPQQAPMKPAPEGVTPTHVAPDGTPLVPASQAVPPPAPPEPIPPDPEDVAKAQLAEEDCNYLNDIKDQFQLTQSLKLASVYRDVFGYGALYPVYDRIPDPQHPLGFYLGNLKKLRILDSTRLQIIRDNVFDLRQLYTFFPNIPDKLEAMGKPARPNNTGRIVGFVLTISADTRTKLIDASGNEIKPDVWARLYPGMDEMSIDYTRVFYYDDELIIFFRDSSNAFPDGVSLFRANYTMLENKLMLERVAATGYAKSVIPTWIVTLPPGMIQYKTEVAQSLQQSREQPGADIIMMAHEGLGINRTISDGLMSAEPLLEYFEKIYSSSMGIFDSMTNSAGANRATAQIQSDLFNKMIQPLREDIENIVNTRFFMPLLEKKHGMTPSMIMQSPASVIAGAPDDPQQVPRQDVIETDDLPYCLPKWKWGALIEDEKADLLASFAPFVPVMAQNQINFVLEQFGGLPEAIGEPVGGTGNGVNINIAPGDKGALTATGTGGNESNPTPQTQQGQKGSNPNPVKVASTSTQSTGTGPTSRQAGSPSGRDALQNEVSSIEDEDVFRTLDERRKAQKLPPLKKGGKIIPIPDNYVLYDPDSQI